MARPKIVVDEAIPFAAAALEAVGDARLVPASAITPELVREADVLWVRSTRRVDAALLDGSRVRFVGTATSGAEHLDAAWLDARGIAWAAAPGSNAASVQLWWAAALCTLSERKHMYLRGLRVGVVGVGEVGRRVEAFAAALGAEVLRCDPPRARREGPEGFLPLAEVCRRADVLTLHVPLTDDGPDPTRHLLDAVRLDELHDGAVVVNASRGAVVDSRALLAARQDKHLSLVLDVYEGEPEVPPALVAAADLATPHVAGHSIDGKAAGTKALYDATCAFLGLRGGWSPARLLPPPPVRSLSTLVRRMPEEALVLKVLRRFYRVEDDDRALRDIARLPDGKRGPAFEAFRAAYRGHREPAGLRLELIPPRPRACAALATLGIDLLRYDDA